MIALLLAFLLWTTIPTPSLELPLNTPPPCAGGNAADVTGLWPRL